MQENSGVERQFQKMAFFRMDGVGMYRLRILPLAPGRDGSLERGSYGHLFRRLALIYVLDLNNRSKGIQILTLSHSLFRDLEDRRSKLWQPALSKNPYAACPVSSVYNAFPVEIEKRRSGNMTEYILSIDSHGESDALSPKELDTLMEAPRLPEIISLYSRYGEEAPVEEHLQNWEQERRDGE